MLSTGRARPIDAAIKRFGSLVEDRAKIVKATCPGFKYLLPSCLEIILHCGGFILDTDTRFRSAISASRNASSKLVRQSLCIPFPFVRNIILGTYSMGSDNGTGEGGDGSEVEGRCD
jgi:hypothetical protein